METKCYNCKYASTGFKIGDITHHQCNHPKHNKGLKSGKITEWDTLREFYQTCEDHQMKEKQDKQYS